MSGISFVPRFTPSTLGNLSRKDGSFCVVAQKLVPVSVAVDDILFQEKIDETLCAIEDVLGLDADSLSSTSGYAGLSDDRMDYLMSEMEQTIVSMDAKN